MPKFVSGTSGQIYAYDKLSKEEDEILSAISNQQDQGTSGSDLASDVKKPSAINKKSAKEKQKSSLDLFKEELRRINEERDEQRNKVKNSINTSLTQSSLSPSQLKQQAQQLVPVPLKPDSRCPTTLTLQVNLNPKDKDSSSGVGAGSFDTGDPTTTNLYLGNLNPIVTENDLCDIFGKFGSLASIKIMWPRTEEERARNRNSGFVAYMSRVDADRALKTLNGMEFKGYELKLGWGKAVPLPTNPVFIPKELIELMQPPPQSGLPFNAQMHKSDIERGYKVPNPLPRPPPPSSVKTDPECVTDSDKDSEVAHDTYREFIEVFQRSTVQVYVPEDRSILDRIHKTIEYVIREGPVFETIIIANESKNPNYKFLYDYQSMEHVYYRWKLYSVLHGDDPYKWSTDEFRMFEGGPSWRPPPLNPFANGMPLELVEKLTGINREILLNTRPNQLSRKMEISNEPTSSISKSSYLKFKGEFSEDKVKILTEMLANLSPTKSSIGSAMLFCINHSYAADEIINSIVQSLDSGSVPLKVKIAQLFLISDVLQNSSAAVTNASFYRKGFESRLVGIFEKLRDYLHDIDDRYKAEKFKQKVLSVLGAWSYFQLYEKKFLFQLSNVFLDISDTGDQLEHDLSSIDVLSSLDRNSRIQNLNTAILDEQLDGEPIDDATLADCLEQMGLSLRWYKTLELSEDESDDTYDGDGNASEGSGKIHRARSESSRPGGGSPAAPSLASVSGQDTSGTSVRADGERTKFKTSKWEVVTQSGEEADYQPQTRLLSTMTPTTNNSFKRDVSILKSSGSSSSCGSSPAAGQ